MSAKKIIKRIVLFLLVIGLGYGIYYAWVSFPIITGYDAKNVCSCVFVAGRAEDDVIKNEVGDFPLSLASINVDHKDSSVTANILGVAKRKAIFRSGWGCTLVNDVSEEELRSQTFVLNATTTKNDSLFFPYGDRLRDSLPQGIDVAKVLQAVDYAFKPNDEKENFTRAVVVVYDGQLVAEKYADGYNATSRMLGWSMAKSFTSTYIGILVNDGKLNVSAPAPVQQWQEKDDPRQAITLENLLQQTAGLNFTEDYSSYSEATNMLFNRGNMAVYAANIPLKVKPGTEFYYSSGTSNILSGIVRSTVGEEEYKYFPYRRLFHKIGMYSAIVEPDASGTFVGSSYIFATARDYARFGLLYLNDGVWNGERILPEGWVKNASTAPAGNKLKNYGYQFWLNGLDKKEPTRKVFPDAPDDLFFADGFGGQHIFIIPSKKLVIVRLGLKGLDDENAFIKQIVDAVK